MEGQEELVVGDHQQTQMLIKGKRTKRQRPMSPFGLAVTSSSSSACGGAHGGEEYGNSFTSASYDSTEEEEDMANCLILLAQGCHMIPKQQTSRTLHEATAVSSHVGKAGFYVYECKTCNRTFPSFQALGGHRASHKKPKSSTAAMADQEKKPASTHFTSASMDQEVEDSKQFVKKSSPPTPTHPTVPIQIKGFQSNNNKAKIHECSICGSEFTSGQALGGHMRRHRAAVANNNATTSTTQVVGIGAAIDNSMRSKQERSILALDLNLPAPEDHDHHHHHHQQHQIHHQRDSKFQFVPTQQTSLVFNAPALVDCHY
ncbi:zinc finger protein ZAT5 [Rosa sericea]